ncbi:MAG: Hsp20/alpha crystallin family protein [Anaerolineales bacterium]|nr:Hsp20/alpha crystallin family protein [Anaerolineales bacterium]
MYLVNRSPSRDMLRMRQAVNQLFDESYTSNTDSDYNQVYRLPIDVYSTENEIVLTASVPGMSAEDVSITIEGETLSISGEIPALIENVDWQFVERYHGKFCRTLQLNVPIDMDNAEATFKNGILELVLPKAEAVKPKQIKVKTK